MRSFRPVSALQQGHVSASVLMIEVLRELPSDVREKNLVAIMIGLSAHFETLSKVLSATHRVFLQWMEDAWQTLSNHTNFYHLFAMVMRAKDSKEWFNSANEG